MNRKRVILGSLLGVLAVCLVYAYLATPRLEKAPPRAAGLRTQPTSQGFPEGGEKETHDRIDFAYQTEEPQEFTGSQRDIFRFGQRRPVETASTTRVVKREVSEPVVLPEVVPVEVIKKSLSQFTFLGFLEKAGEKTVFLSSGGNLFLVKQGEHFGVGQEFLVVQIDDKLLKVRHAGREGLIEVQLIEKQKLNAAVSAPVSISRDAGSVGQTVNARPLRPQRRIVRPVGHQEDQGPQGGLRQEDQGLQDDLQEDDQGLQGDGNFWPAKKR